ncbi:MAG: rod shape-determining protein MreD [Ruminococcus sp.]|nr:rod shape-determining protein MreD [Ruminococcus sp.]
MRIKTPKEKRTLIYKTIIRWILYYILIFFSFVLMTSGTMLKPVLMIPIALCIAVNNNQIGSALTGAACGFLIDISCGKLLGYNAVILTFFCILVSLLFELYLRNRFINILIASAAVSFIQGWLDYKFYYEIWNYDNVERIFSTVTIPVWILTVISTVFVYLIIRLINHFLLPKEHLTLEEAIKTN